MAIRAGVGDGTPSGLDFEAMADVDRMFIGRFEVDVECVRGGGAALVLCSGGGLSGLGVALPLPCVVGDLADLGDSGCD